MRAVPPTVFVILTSPCFAQTTHAVDSLPTRLPPGLTLPIRLERPLRSGHTPAGTPIRARLTQRVPVAEHDFLPTHTELLGTVVASSPTTLTLRFDHLRLANHTIPVQTTALALANFVAVSDTSIPCAGAVDRANPDPANWTTCQVGGDQVVRSGWSGPVLDARSQVVGSADFYGVYTTPSTPGALPHALGVFSPGARGLFGYGPDTTVTTSGADFTLHSPKPLTVHIEDNLLLEVTPSSH